MNNRIHHRVHNIVESNSVKNQKFVPVLQAIGIYALPKGDCGYFQDTYQCQD